MNDFENRMPEFDAMALLQQKLASKKSSTPSNSSPNPKGAFDPHELMVKRKAQTAGEIAADYPTQTWPEEDINKLEEFCRQHGIIGFNCGTMSPLAALAFLKNKLGVIDQPPRTEGYGPNYPYTQAMKKRILLNG